MTKPNFNPVGWFHIPVTDMARAIKFYSDVFGFAMTPMGGMEGEFAFFPSDEKLPGIAGMLVRHNDCKPSATGTLVHFESPSGLLDNELKLIEKAGGKIMKPKTSTAPHGFYAFVQDTEGNVIGIHSKK